LLKSQLQGCYKVTLPVILILLDGGICNGRRSSGMPLTRGQDTIIRTIEKRIADYTSIPVAVGT